MLCGGLYGFDICMELEFLHIKSGLQLLQSACLSGGVRTRTYDLWVMSPTSYHCSTPRCFRGAKVDIISELAKYLE